MAYDNEKNEKPVQTHKGFEQQKAEYSKIRQGGHTSRPTIPEGLHPQNKAARGYTKPRPK